MEFITAGDLSLFDFAVIEGQCFGRNLDGAYLVSRPEEGERWKYASVLRKATAEETDVYYKFLMALAPPHVDTCGQCDAPIKWNYENCDHCGCKL